VLRQILSVTWKDLKILFKDARGIAILFLMPMMFILVVSTALQTHSDSESLTIQAAYPWSTSIGAN
jgi:hypothetical protein